MTFSLYNRLYTSAQDSPDLDSYIADTGSAWDVLDYYGEDTAFLIRDLTAIWHVAHEGTRYIRSVLRMTQAEFSCTYQIPMRTVEDWDRGRRQAPAYVISLLAIASGCYQFRVGED